MTRYFPALLLVLCGFYAFVVATVVATSMTMYEIGSGISLLIMVYGLAVAGREIERTPEMPRRIRNRVYTRMHFH
jgi:hypothetical protein